VSIVYISHFLDEVTRDGRPLHGAARRSHGRLGCIDGGSNPAQIEHLIETMVGRRITSLFPRIAHTPGDVVLAVSDLRGARLPHRAGLQLRRGEILGSRDWWARGAPSSCARSSGSTRAPAAS
jgi:ribose transport system ATP-binding protein